MKKIKAVGKFFSILVLIGLLLFLLLLLLVELNKPFLIHKAESWYATHHSGELKIDDFDFQVFASFPHLRLQIDKVSLRDSSYAGRNYHRLSANRIALSCSTPKLFLKKLEFNRFEIEDAFIDMLVDTLDPSTPEIKKLPKNSEPVADLEEWFAGKGVDFEIKNTIVSIVNRPNKKRYTGTINEVSGIFKADGTILSGPLRLDIDMDEMGLNVEKGTFFNTAHVRGNLNPTINLHKKEFFAPSFKLKIDDQDFLVSAHFNLGKDNFFDFELINEATDYQASKGLIAQNIQTIIEPYELLHPFYTKTKIQGKFKGEGNALVSLDFNTYNNQLIFSDSVHFDSLGFTGHLANRSIGDEFANSKNKKDFHLIFSKVNGYFQDVPFRLQDSYIQSTPAVKNLIQLDLSATGKTERLNQILKNDAFFFKSGIFELNSFFKGDVKNPLDVLTYADSQLKINKTNVFYNKAALTVPVRRIRFLTKNGNALLKSMRLEFPGKQYLEVSGKLKNYTSLIFDELDAPIKSVLNIESKGLDYDGLIATIQAATEQTALEEIADDLEKTEKDLRAAFENIYVRFNPELSIRIDTFSYKNILIENFRTFVTYQDKNTLTLSKSNFKFGDGDIKINGAIHLPEGNTTEASLGIKANGAMSSLNELFDNKDFLLRQGTFDLTADYQGSLDHPDNLITGSEVDLRIKDTRIYHADQDLMIPIDTALITLKKRDAAIAGLSIPFPQGNTVELTGKVNNFTSLLKEEAGYEVNSRVKIYSQHLSSKNFGLITDIFTSNEKKEPKDKNALHRGVTTVYKKFNPSLTVQIDTFTSQDYLLENVHSSISYKDSSLLSVEETSFELDDGRLDLAAVFNFSEEEKINSQLSLSAHGQARRFDKLFNNNTFFFKEGVFDFDLKFNGDLLDKKRLLESLDSRITLDDSRVFYKDMNLTVPLDDVDLMIKNNDATVNGFVIPLTSGHRIQVTGKVDNFTRILIDSIPKEVVSNLNIYSKELDFEDLSRMFNVITEADSLSQKPEVDTTQKINVFKPTVQGIYDKFLPTIKVAIDNFSYKTFQAKDIKTGLQFEDRNHLELQKTAFKLGDTHVLLNAILDLTEPERTGFDTNFTTKNLELEKLVPAFDFFGLPSLKSAGNVSGILSVDSHLKGHVIDEKGSLDSTMQGTVAFNLEGLRLQNFKPIMSSAGKILKDKRIRDIQFLPLADTLRIKEGTIKIPTLNITSTAFTFYLKGDFRYDNQSNLLVSIPWSNLFFWDAASMPDHLTYNESGRKFHVQALGNEENTMDYKFRFTGRKWYKAKGILHLYRRDKKLYRIKRRTYKRLQKEKKRQKKER